MEKVEAVILAGGKGTRLQSVVAGIPKPLAPINEVPFLDILLAYLDRSGCFRNVVLALGYGADRVIERYGRKRDYDFSLTFSTESCPLGTGGALKKALEQVGSSIVVGLNGDTFVAVDYAALLKSHRESSAELTVVLREVENAGRYGNVRVNPQGKILSFDEKLPVSKPGLINAGVYVFYSRLFAQFQADTPLSMETDLLPRLIRGEARAYQAAGKFIDIGTPESYRLAQKILAADS